LALSRSPRTLKAALLLEKFNLASSAHLSPICLAAPNPIAQTTVEQTTVEQTQHIDLNTARHRLRVGQTQPQALNQQER